MLAVDRRAFLGTSVPGFAAALVGVPSLSRAGDSPGSRPDTLFLTWQHDPTTTVTVQWIGAAGVAPDVHVSAHGKAESSWVATRATSRPFPLTDLRVFRAEVTGL